MLRRTVATEELIKTKSRPKRSCFGLVVCHFFRETFYRFSSGSSIPPPGSFVVSPTKESFLQQNRTVSSNRQYRQHRHPSIRNVRVHRPKELFSSQHDRTATLNRQYRHCRLRLYLQGCVRQMECPTEKHNRAPPIRISHILSNCHSRKRHQLR